MDTFNSEISFQILKSSALDPIKGYFSKKGIIILVISDSLVTVKLWDDSPTGSNLPQLKKSIKLFNKIISLLCWVIWQPIWTLRFLSLECVFTKKQPSPSVNPTTQLGSIIFDVTTKGFVTGTALEKAFLKMQVNLCS